ncbi:MAG TPA: hypothetical protein VFW75_06225 [Acetobacteraceae bacterium]|nr:hypothetical protein [Acetobacteraceae bacterium]
MRVIANLVPALALAGIAGGCAQGPNAAQIIQEVEARTKQICKFVPEAKPIVALIPTFGGIASQIADAICNAVNSTPRVAAPGAQIVVPVGNVMVPGVLVR